MVSNTFLTFEGDLAFGAMVDEATAAMIFELIFSLQLLFFFRLRSSGILIRRFLTVEGDFCKILSLLLQMYEIIGKK